MKKHLLFLFTALLPLVASAQTTVEIDGIWYNLVSKAKQAEVTSSDGDKYSGSITLTATVTVKLVEKELTITDAYVADVDLTDANVTFGEAIDGKGPLPLGDKPYFIKNAPPPAQFRDRVQGKVDLGVKSVNTFLTICKGQRMGIFAGSGVGKSTLMSNMARHTDSDISVIGLIGERGREVREFIETLLD